MASDFTDDVGHEEADGMKFTTADEMGEEVKADIVLAGVGVDDRPLEEPEVEEYVPRDLGEGEQTEIDAKNFRVMQGRDKKDPSRKRVNAIKRAIQAGRKVERVIVYQDIETDEQFSPNGGHRQQAYDELGLPVPVIIFKIRKARERAELESCFANENNGKDRSDADKKFQATKAVGILEEKLGRPPRPKELADVTHTSLKFATSFLRTYFAPVEKHDDDEPENPIPASLQNILEKLQEITIPNDWSPGFRSNPILNEIDKTLSRIKKYKRPEPEITSKAIATFMKASALSKNQMAKLADVTHTTISRWVAGTVAISESNLRTLRQVLSYSKEQIAALLDDEIAENIQEDADA